MATAIFDPKNVPVISRIHIGDKDYYLKDAEVRTLLLTLGTAAQRDVAAGVAAGEEGLVTGAQVQTAIAAVSGALQFVGKYDTLEAANASGKTFKNGDIILVGVKEYIRYDGAWIELGDEGIYALKSTTIAGIDLNDNISVTELQNALGLHAMAYANTASGNVAAQNITGVTATGTSTGSISVKLSQTDTAATLTKGDYTPAGNVTGTTTAAGTVTLAEDAAKGVQITGSVSAPDITVTPAKASVQFIDSVGSQASFTEGAFHPGTDSTFTQGDKASWSASVDANETLSFSWTANGNDVFTPGDLPSKDPDEFTANELPTKATAMQVVTGITSATATAPTFTGNKFAATFTGTEADITASFEGTKATGALVTGVNYSKAGIDTANTKFTGAAITLDVGTITVPAHSVTVNPDAVTSAE